MNLAVKKQIISIDPTYRMIMESVRDLMKEKGVRGYSLEDIYTRINITKEVFYKYVADETDLVKKVLEFERENFKVIFEEYDFDGVNAIEILMTVSIEMSRNFKNLNPSLTFDLKKYYPEVYQEHFQKRIDFIFNQIKLNITKGIKQGMYREDLSIELVARLYISRLIDIHNPDFFPPERFSFSMLFEVMFENFIRSIAKPEGLKYFENKVKAVDF